MNNIGKCMGIYFYIIGIMQIVSIFIVQKTTGNIYLDLQFIGWFVAGYYLMKHYDKARKIIIIICGIFLYTTFAGISESASWKIMGFPIEGDNVEKYLRFGALIVGIVYVVPFFVLKSKKAIKEFNNY